MFQAFRNSKGQTRRNEIEALSQSQTLDHGASDGARLTFKTPKTIKKGTARPYPKSITLSQQGIGGKKREAYLWSALIDKNTAK